MRIELSLIVAFSLAAVSFAFAADAPGRWTPEQASAWYAKQPWLVGGNFVPTNAINQLEMWQADSFDPAQIDKELGWAEGIGMTTMRVFLHDLLWQQDAAGFKSRIDQFLTICTKHHIKPLLVLFDSCWDPNPKLGKQHAPVPGVHNSGWVQGPGSVGLLDESQTPRLHDYVVGVVGAFAKDDRVLGWDVWNEPDNGGGGNYDQPFDEKTKNGYVAKLLPQVFSWAREQQPIQPLTSALWRGEDWSKTDTLNAVQKEQIELSDVISFHNYDWPEIFEARIKQLQPLGRPLICSEYMARANGSTFDTILPMGRTYNIGMINWGFALGKTQTNLPWESWQHPYIKEQPPIWFHDIFKPDGTPYRQAEVELIRKLTQEAKRN